MELGYLFGCPGGVEGGRVLVMFPHMFPHLEAGQPHARLLLRKKIDTAYTHGTGCLTSEVGRLLPSA